MSIEGYHVQFVNASGHGWFYTIVTGPNGDVVAEKSVCRNYNRAAKWALARISDHRRALERLGTA